VRRAQYIGVGLTEQIVVALEAAVAAQQALILEAPYRLADSELAHRLALQMSAARHLQENFVKVRSPAPGPVLKSARQLLAVAGRRIVSTWM
jgi:hypothetical protein